MQQTGILILTSPIRSLADNIGNYLATASKYISKRLYIKLEPSQDKLHPPLKKSSSDVTLLYKFIPTLYSKASVVCGSLDIRLLLSSLKNATFLENHLNLPVDLVLTDSSDTTANIKQYMDTQFQKTCLYVIKLDKYFGSNNNNSHESENAKVYDTVVLGGTFDRLHNGHKILLSTAAARTVKKLVIGVTDGFMLKRKHLWELIEPLQERMKNVQDFVKDIDSTIVCSVVPIYDPFGPATEDPTMNCIVVSEETKKGGLLVNQERLKKQMNELDVLVVNLLQDPSYLEGHELKISSSNRRRCMLGTFLKKAEKKPLLNQPLSIALIGGPMDGKSIIFKGMQNVGVPTIDTHDIIIELLNPHSSVFKELKKLGFNITGVKEDIKSLSFSVLKDQSKRNLVKSILLPAVKSVIKSKLEQDHKSMQSGAMILIKIAEFLIDEWVDDFTCIWTSIMPEQQRIQKLKDFYGISDAEASQIISTYPSNVEFVQKAHIVLSPQWSDADTKKQVQKAYENIKLWTVEKKSSL